MSLPVKMLNTSGMCLQVTQELCNGCYAALDGAPAPQHLMMVPFDGNISPVSALDDLATPTAAILALASSDKRFGKAISSSSNFLVDSDKLKPPVQNPFQRMMNPRAFVSAGGAAGTAIEHHTILGRMLRAGSASPRDAKVVEMFKDAAKQPKSIVDGNVGRLRSRSALVQGQTYDVLMALLKDKQSKVAALMWMKQCVSLNLESAKEQPNFQYASSRAFLVNYAAVMLRLCRPFMGDLEKIKKIDWQFLISVDSSDVFPTDETPVTAAIPENHFAGSISRRLLAGKDFNFMTQSLFLTWRALHLGAVNECVNYGRVMRGINHFRAELTTGHPQATAYLVHKFVLDAQLLSPDFVADVLSFCSTTCQFLMLHLHTASAGGTSNWRIDVELDTPSALDQYALLAGMPQHLLEDICELMLFVAKTDGTFFRSVDMAPVHAVLLYFLRRPWAVGSPHLRAKLGQVLFYVFLPSSERKNVEHYTVSVRNAETWKNY